MPTTNDRMPRFGSARPCGVHRREALVVVVVAGERDVDAVLPAGSARGRPSRPCRRASRRRSGGGATSRPCRAPDAPRGPGAARRSAATRGRIRRHVPAIAVQDHDVPRAEVVAVVARLPVARRRTEVVEVRRGARRPVVVISEGRARAGPMASPRRSVALAELGERPGLVGVVSEREDRAVDPVEQLGRLLRAAAAAVGDVTRADEDGIRGDRRRRRAGRGRLCEVQEDQDGPHARASF